MEPPTSSKGSPACAQPTLTVARKPQPPTMTPSAFPPSDSRSLAARNHPQRAPNGRVCIDLTQPPKQTATLKARVHHFDRVSGLPVWGVYANSPVYWQPNAKAMTHTQWKEVRALFRASVAKGVPVSAVVPLFPQPVKAAPQTLPKAEMKVEARVPRRSKRLMEKREAESKKQRRQSKRKGRKNSKVVAVTALFPPFVANDNAETMDATMERLHSAATAFSQHLPPLGESPPTVSCGPMPPTFGRKTAATASHGTVASLEVSPPIEVNAGRRGNEEKTAAFASLRGSNYRCEQSNAALFQHMKLGRRECIEQAIAHSRVCIHNAM